MDVKCESVKFSIITPTRNVGDCIKELVDSIQEQTFEDWEHIIVDSASTDGALALIPRHDKVRVFSEPDKGIYDAMNKGVALAQGEWLYFIGADDRFFDQHVLSNVNQFLDDSVDVVYGDVVSTRFGGRYDGPFDDRKIRSKNICHQAVFVRRQVFELIGGFNDQYLAQADWDHNMRWMLNKSIRSKYIDLVIAEYSDGGYSSTNLDPVYQSDHVFNYLRYGKDVLPAKVRIRALVREMLVSLKFFDLKRFFVCLAKIFQEFYKAVSS